MVVFVEGLPGSGKTCLIRSIERRGYPVVHELGRVIKQEEFPGNGSTLEEIIKINAWFIDKESLRYNDCITKIYDRSYFTHLSYAYSYSIYTGIHAFRPTVFQYMEAISNERLAIPDVLIYLDINVEESINRQKIRVTKKEQHALPPFWTQTNFLENTKHADYILMDCLENIEIIIIDAEKSTFEKMKIILPKLNLKNTYKTMNLEKYLTDLA